MSQFGAIMWAKRRIAYHSMAAVRTESKLKVGVVGVAAVLLWLGVLAGFWRGFLFLQNFLPNTSTEVIGIGDILMARLLSVFALALFFMLIFSNVLIAFSTLYKATQVKYLLQSPISIREFFLAGLVECVSFSSWATAYLGSPLILAYGITTDAHWSYYFAAIAFYIPYVTIPASIGATLTIVFVRIFPRLPRVILISIAAVSVGWVFLYIRQSFSAERLAEETMLSAVLQAASQTQSPLLPSYWAAQGVLAASSADYGETLFLFLLLVANAMFAVLIAAEIANAFFMTGFSAVLGSDNTQLRPLGKGVLGRLDDILRFIKEPIHPLVVKDIKLFWRDPTQWTQFVVFFGIMSIYIANLGNSGITRQSDMYRSWTAGLNSGACTLILASLTSRFVYPLVSLEGFRFWIIGLAPISLRQIVWQKFWLSVLTTAPFTVGLVLLSNFFLEVDALRFAMSVYSILLANLTLAGLAVGLGSLYPNFEEDNPARIVSGMGGTLNFLLSVGYIVLLVGSQVVVLQMYEMERFVSRNLFWQVLAGVLAFNTLLSVIGVILPMRIGLRNLERTEF